MTTTVTMECAGNGRARLSPRPISQPWLGEAVGTAEWTGTPLRPLLEEAGPLDEAVELVFAGADRGIQKEIEHDYERSLPIADALRDEVLLAYEMNGAPLPPQHGFPLRLVVPGLVRDDERQMADPHHRRARTVRGLPAAGLPVPPRARGRRDTRHADGSPLAHDPARHPGLHDAEPHRGRRTPRPARPCLVRVGLDRAGRGERGRGLDLGDRGARRCALAARVAFLVVRLGCPSPAPSSSAAGRRTRRATCSRSSRRGTSAGSRTTRCSACRSRSARRA